MANSILDTIVSSVRSQLPIRMREMPISSLEDRPLFSRKPLSFASALRKTDLTIIAEIKRASPSAGVIRDDFDAAQIAASYSHSGADAISVVTESEYFQGSVDYLEDVRACTRLPLLRKDFIVDPYQICEARAYGADAVLLIVCVLSAQQLIELQDAASELHLSTLIEVHQEDELDRIDLERTQILGVNNRDLATFEVDVLRAGRILANIPDRVVRVAESGMRTGEDLAVARRRGIDAVLIGEAFMRAPDPGARLEGLRSSAQSVLDGFSS